MNIIEKAIKYLNNVVKQHRSILIRRRVKIAIVFSLVAIIISLTMAITALQNQEYLLVIADIGILSIFISFFITLRNGLYNERSMINGSIGIGILLISLYLWSGFKSNTYLWFYTYPLISISICGLKKGSILFFVFLAVIVLFTFVNNFYSRSIDFDSILFFRFILSLIIVYFLSSYMEQTSEQENLLLEENNEELKKAHKDLQELTIRDPLTGLFNRRYLDEILPLAISQSRRYNAEVAVLMIDIDYFKKYNDHYGHQQGDKAIKFVAQVLSDCLRRETDYACRYGGEEFAVILNKSSKNAVDFYAEALINTFQKSNEEHIHGIEGRVTVSIGTATADQQGSDTHTTLIERADRALYEAKRLGRNRYCKL